MVAPSNSVAALLLTGGASRRMGQPKSSLLLEGTTLGVRSADLLSRVCEVVLEVGPGVSGLKAVSEVPRGGGPLAAIAAGCQALRSCGCHGAALVLACDLPFVSERLLRFLVEWDSNESVIPLVDGHSQPLCAKWSAKDLDYAARLVKEGVRSVKHVASQPSVVLIDEAVWGTVIDEREFSDVDSPSDLERLGLNPQFKAN